MSAEGTARSDLESLKIERGESGARRPARRSPWFARLFVLALVAGLLFVFRRPLLGLADRFRLPKVDALTVSATSPIASAAVSGTAANGYVVARVRAALSADTPGRIVEMNVQEGSVVQKGQVVARLYSDEYRALLVRAEADLSAALAQVDSRKAGRDVAQAGLEERRSAARRAAADAAEAGASLRLAQADLERADKLVAEGIAAQERHDATLAERDRSEARAEAAAAAIQQAADAFRSSELELIASEAALREADALVKVKEAERDQARATLDKTEVRAPFDGVVVLKDAEVGEVVSPNSQGGNSRGSVCTMVDFASLEVQVELPETSLTAAEVGRPAAIFLDAYPEHAYAGRVLRIWPTANRQKATVEVRVGFEDPDGRLRPEMGARVVFSGLAPAREEGGPPAILIPRGAVVAIEGRSHVFVLERDVARLRPVELGDERSGRVLVKTGLADGERIVASPPNALQDGDRVLLEEGP